MHTAIGSDVVFVQVIVYIKWIEHFIGWAVTSIPIVFTHLHFVGTSSKVLSFIATPTDMARLLSIE